MAITYTEVYVSPAGSGDNSGSDASNFMPYATALSDATANPCRYNLVSGTYTAASSVVLTAGTGNQYRIWRGYTSTIGDLDDQGRGTDGFVDTTNFPVFNVSTKEIVPSNYSVFQNMYMTTAGVHEVFGSSSKDQVVLINCKVENTGTAQNNGGVLFDNTCYAYNCDIFVGGRWAINADDSLQVINCRLDSGFNASATILCNFGIFINNIITGHTSGLGIQTTSTATKQSIFYGNTFYDCGEAITFGTSSLTYIQTIINNSFTDCLQAIDGRYASGQPVIRFNNRTRDNTSADVLINEIAKINEVTTDTGDDTTDFTDASTDDFSLISGAPAVNAGLNITGFMDIGAQQQEPTGGGGGGTLPVGRKGLAG